MDRKNTSTYNPKFQLSTDEYWDLYLYDDPSLSNDIDKYNGSSLNDECLISNIDFSNKLCIEYGNIHTFIMSNPELDDNGEYKYIWDESINNNVILNNIGLTGTDNGFIKLTEESYCIDSPVETSYKIPDGVRLTLFNVDGNTGKYIYPYTIDNNDNSISLSGGFFQGFFKIYGHEYQVLPTCFDDEIAYEFILNKNEKEISHKILNDDYPDNKGIFFYIGTRAENKFYYYTIENDADLINLNFRTGSPNKIIFYSKVLFKDISVEIKSNIFSYEIYINDTLVTDEIFTINIGDTVKVFVKKNDDNEDALISLIKEIDIHDKVFETSSGIDFFKPNIVDFITDNKYLFYNRTENGSNACNSNNKEYERIVFQKRRNDINFYTIFNRTDDGVTVCDTINGAFNVYDNEININNDIYLNAMAFMIKDDGSIGVRLLTKNCDNEIEILNSFSNSNVISENSYHHVVVRVIPFGNKMKLMFYVDSKLVHVTDLMPKINLRELNEHKDKQEGVPFNISIGGGTQGLADTVIVGLCMKRDPLPLEENFAGSFIGNIRLFNIYNCTTNFVKIKNNYLFYSKKLLK